MNHQGPGQSDHKGRHHGNPCYPEQIFETALPEQERYDRQHRHGEGQESLREKSQPAENAHEGEKKRLPPYIFRHVRKEKADQSPGQEHGKQAVQKTDVAYSQHERTGQ